MIFECLLAILTAITLSVSTVDVHISDYPIGNISIQGNYVLGKNMSISCLTTAASNETVVTEIMTTTTPVDTNHYFYKIYINEGHNYFKGDLYHSRLTITSVDVQQRSIIMDISNLQCVDEGHYSCLFVYGMLGERLSQSFSTAEIVIEACPKAPSLEILPDSSSYLTDQTLVDVTCRAYMGFKRSGCMQWNIYRNDSVEIVQAGDPRIIDNRIAPAKPEDHKLSHRLEQTFRFRISEDDQNLMIACFVMSSDFPRALTPIYCHNPDTDLCRQTEPLVIFAVESDLLMFIPYALLGVVFGVLMLFFMACLCITSGKQTSPEIEDFTLAKDTDAVSKSSRG